MPENPKFTHASYATFSARENYFKDETTGTLSSKTSDLGSSIERSQHMKTILGPPKVLIQPPITGIDSCNSKLETLKTDPLSQSADSAIREHFK